MIWTFTKGKKVTITSGDAGYALVSGEIQPAMLLHKLDEVKKLKAAIETIRDFVGQAEEEGRIIQR